jgi:hypothetical protein
MDCAELEFEYHTADQLLSHCHWTQNTLPSAQDLNLCRFLRLLSTVKFLLTKIGTQALALRNQRGRDRSDVPPTERCGAMQATKKRQSVLQDNRFTQGCPTLTLKQGCICQYWFIRLPSQLEGTA